MSAIVGMYYLDDRPVDQTNLERMVALLVHRGPDGAGVWHEGPIGLGHCLLWTTPESVQEHLPLICNVSDLVITADARIDNRAKLIAMLGLTNRPPGEIADSQLILTAYEKWGETCPEQLLGETLPLLSGISASRRCFAPETIKGLRAERLHKFFQRIIKLSTMRAGTCDMQLETRDLCEVVRVAIREVSAQAGEREVQIEPKLDIEGTTLLDRNQMKEVVTAMLDNAIRFSPAQGQVVVGVRREDKAICLQVTDHGAGIDPAFLPYVFGEFFDADVDHHSEGHGLSLAIARQIVLAHSGTMYVESTQGEGTTFTVQLPLAA